MTLTIWLRPAVERETQGPSPVEPSVQSDPTPTVLPDPTPTVQPYPIAAPLTLELRAREEVWVQLSIDGSQVLDTILDAGQARPFEGEQSASILIGNAASLTVLWNGEDLGSLGGSGQVRRLYFSPTEVGFGRPPPG